jgi:hypothetical protein
MAYSFTEKKRIRKDFGKHSARSSRCRSCWRSSSIPTAQFLQETSPSRGACEHRPARRLQVGVPDRRAIQRQRRAGVRELSARRAGVRRQGVPAAWPDLRRAAAREGAPGHLRQGSPRQGDQGRQGAGGLHGRNAADDRQRHLRHQRHRARHRLAAAPLAGRVLRPRPRQDHIPRASCCSPPASFPTAARGSTSSSTRRTACSCASTAAASCRSRSCCAPSATTTQEMLDMFFDINVFILDEGESCSSWCRAPARRDRGPSRSAIGEGKRHRRGRPPHHRAPRPPAREGGVAARAGRAARLHLRQDPGARRGRHRHRRDLAKANDEITAACSAS